MPILANKLALIVTIGFIAFGGCIGIAYYKGKHAQDVIDRDASQQAIIKNQTLAISKMRNQDILTNHIIVQTQNQLNQMESNYASAQQINQALSKKINSTNRINQLLVRSLSNFTSTNSMPINSRTTSSVNDSTSYVNPTQFINGIGEQLNYCNTEMIRFQNLQNWIIQTQKNFNSK